MREVFLLIDTSGAIVWSDAAPTALALPDSRARWEAIWRHREVLGDLVHSHPVGPRAFSREDQSTMTALEAALGKPLRFSVLAPGGLVVREAGLVFETEQQPWWAELLRLASGMG